MSNILTDGISANELVLDLLAAHEAHELSAALLCRAGGFLGIGEQTLRVALTRLVQQGKVTARARAVYALNPGGDGLFEDVRNWLHKERQMAPWAGDWLGVLYADKARGDRSALKKHSKALERRGFKLFGNGLYLRPANIAGGIAQVRQELLALGLAPSATVIGVCGLSEAEQQTARGLWDTLALYRAYSDCLSRLEASEAALPSMSLEQAAAHTLIEGRQVIRRIILDPLLPDELFDSTLRHRLIERMTAYQATARAIWMQALA